LTHKREGIKESAPKVPGYIVTFSDMVTLLLTFFVLLLTLSSVQDPELFNKGRDSFLSSIAKLGFGMLPGKKRTFDFGEAKIRYFIVNPDEGYEGRTIDAKQEELRRIFQQMARSAATMRSRIVAEKNNFAVTDIRFAPGSATLNEAAKRSLTKFCLDLQQGAGSRGVQLYVLGLARDEATEQEQWIVSAKRAQAVADFIRDILPSNENSPVYSWGAGPGGEWVRQDSPISKESQILIGVLRGKN
jgi:chemotaxis protein MotB